MGQIEYVAETHEIREELREGRRRNALHSARWSVYIINESAVTEDVYTLILVLVSTVLYA